MDVPDGLVGRLFNEARDSRRPSLEAVLEVIEAAFGKMQIAVRREVEGPPTWIWQDEEMERTGFPKFYVLTTSQSAGIEGYPVFTIRQAYSVRFDTWITFSSLVLGPDTEAITRAIALAMAHHAGAFAGVKYTAATIAANRSSPMAGMVAVKGLMEAPPPRISPEQVEAMTGGSDEESGVSKMPTEDDEREMN